MRLYSLSRGTVLGVALLASLLVPGMVLACPQANPCGKCANNNPTDAQMEHFYGLDDQMTAAYQAGNLARAKSLSDEYLQLAANYQCDWNYGNAIYDANAMLGLISLKSGNADAAADYLVKAGKTPGSPQLDSFGPDMTLAYALLKAGKVDAVRTYLKEIKVFWTMDDGEIDRWSVAINKGELPQLNPYARFSPSPLARIITYLAIAWPGLVTIAFLCVKRKHIARKPLFLLVGAVCAYASMILGGIGAGFGMPYIASRVIDLSASSVLLIFIWLSVVIVWLLPILALYIVYRFFRQRAA